MPDPVIPVVLLILGGGLVAGMWRMGVFTPRSVVAWTRIGRHHHLTDERPLDERLGDRVPSLARFFRETSVPPPARDRQPPREPEHVGAEGRCVRADRGRGAADAGPVRQRELALAAGAAARVPAGGGLLRAAVLRVAAGRGPAPAGHDQP